MSQEFDRAKYYLNHILKPEDKFVFQCQMCGNCCRNRSESILLTGADTFRIAKKLEVSVPEAIDKYTTYGRTGVSSLCVDLLAFRGRSHADLRVYKENT